MILGQTYFAGDSLILRKKSAIIKHFECCHTKKEQNCKIIKIILICLLVVVMI